LENEEKVLLGLIYNYPQIIKDAAEGYDPSTIANYCYDLAKGYHKLWHEHQIIKADSEGAKLFRLQLSAAVANVLESGMLLLGIEMPERM